MLHDPAMRIEQAAVRDLLFGSKVLAELAILRRLARA
jgi:hypothetical protein